VTEDRFLFLTEQGSWQVPDWMLPACFKNHGNFATSVGNLSRWLATQAESLGVEIYPGFAAAEILYGEDGRVRGVATGDMGIGKDGEKTSRYQPGIELHAKYTISRKAAAAISGACSRSASSCARDVARRSTASA
jgi:electron-transferring-flavoprotein dehydrogenase